MGSIQNAFLIMLALNIASVIILQDPTSNVLINFVMNPTTGTWEGVLTALAWASATAFVTMAGALFFFKNETVLWAGVFGALASMMYDPMKDLYNLIAPMNTIIAMLVVGPIYLYFIFTMINWLRAPR